MRIALYGGSFNPPHVAHQLSCGYVLATARPAVDELWMVPTFQHPFDKPLAAYSDRVRMCELAAALYGGRVRVSRIEEELGGASYTLSTVRALKARHPEHELVLVIGEDLLEERTRWHRWAELEREVGFIVVGRGAAHGGLAASAALAMPAVSSTEIRARLASGSPVDHLVAREVVDYIVGRGLYGARGGTAP